MDYGHTITKLKHCFEAAMDVESALECARVQPGDAAMFRSLYLGWEARWEEGEAAYSY